MEPLAGHGTTSQCIEVHTKDGVVLSGIAQGTARRNVQAHTAQDLMFFAGEQVVLLKHLQSGLCLGFCEGSVGRFREADVDFETDKNSPQIVTPSLSPSHSPSPSPSPSSSLCLLTAGEPALHLPLTPHQPLSHTKPRPRTRSQSSGASEEKTFAPAQSDNSHDGTTPTLTALARHSLISSLAIDPLKGGETETGTGPGPGPGEEHSPAPAKGLAQRPGPRKLMSEENLKRAAAHANTPRRLALSSPTIPSTFYLSSASSSQQQLSRSRPISTSDLLARPGVLALSSQLLPKSVVIRHRNSAGLLSPSTQSLTSIADMGNSSSATMTTNMLSIKSSIFKSHIFKPQVLNQQEQQLPRLAPPPEIPVYQLTTPNPSNNSLPSRPASPVNSLYSGKKPVVQPVTPSGSEVPSLLDGAQVSRPVTPINETPVSLSIKKGHKIPRVRTKRDPAVSSSSMASPLPDGQEAGRELYGHPQDHYFSTVFDDLRSKTQNVLRKAGFSIAPDAGLFADRGAGKHTDLKVVRMPPVSTTSTPATDAPSGNKDAKDTTGKSMGFFGRARSRSVKERPPSLMNFQMPPIPTFTPASPSRSPMNTTPSTATDTASTTTSSTATTPMTTSNGLASGSPSGSKLDRLRHWNMSDWGGHQRSNSGPARHSDLSLAQKLVEMEDPRLMDFYAQGKAEGRVHIPPLPPLPPLPPKVMADGGVSGGPEDIRKKKKGHQRRMSEATTLSVASTESTGAYPQRFQIHPFQRQQLPPLQQQPPVERHHRTMSNWFGMGKRRSLYGGEEDFKRPYTVGSTIESGMNSRPTSGLLLEGDDYETDMFDDTDVDDDEQDSQAQHRGDAASTEDRDSTDRSLATDSTERRSHVVVNDYGFILEDTEEESRTGQQELTGTSSSSIMGDVTVKLDSSFLAGHERKKMLKKQQEQNKLDVAKWIQAVTQLEPDQAKKSSKLKKLARRGVPISVRGRVWQFLARSNHYRKPGVFQELLTRGHIPIYDVIARDIDRCYPDHVHFRDGMGGTGQEDLHSILKAYAHYKPSVGYCQGMGRLVGMMLMQMPVEEAFWLLVATIEGYLNEYFTPTLRQLRIDAQVFERLLKSQDPRLAQHLHRNDVSPIMYITQWFLTLFTMSLPWASVLRVWDVFYFDGVKTLFRVGLAVLQICRQHLLEQCPSSSECIDYLLHVPLEILGPEVLLEQTAYRIRLRRENIQKMSAITAGEMDAKEGPPSGTGNAVELHGSGNRKSGAYLYEVHEQNENKAKLGASVPLARPLPFKETRVANHVRAGSLGSPIAVRSLASSVDPVMITAALGAIPTTTTTVAATTTSTRMTTTVAPTHDQTSNYRNAKEGFAGETNAGGEVRNEAGLGSMATDNPTSTSTSVFTKNRPELPRPRSQPSGSRLFMTSTPSLPGAVEDLSPAPLSSFLLAAPPSTTATTTTCSASLSSTPSGFSPLSIFKTRKRAGTMHR